MLTSQKVLSPPYHCKLRLVAHRVQQVFAIYQGDSMPRDSIFDPDGGQTEHSGNRFMGPRADQDSHMPPSVTDGEVSEEEAADLEALAEASEEREDEAYDEKTRP
jgi:hypothetical protein